jgi:hypothetical protein
MSSQAQILQLDVVWLYDQFPSSLTHPTEPLSAQEILREVDFKGAVSSSSDSAIEA